MSTSNRSASSLATAIGSAGVRSILRLAGSLAVRGPSFPSGRLALLVWSYVLVASAMLVWLTIAVPVVPTIAVPFAIGGIDPIVLGVFVWIAVGLATSSRGSADEGRVTIIFGVAPIVASFALGGPTAAIWVAAIGSLERRELSGKVRWYGVLANHAMIMIPAGLGGIVAQGLLGMGFAADPQLGNLTAVAAGAFTFCSLNLALAVLTVYIRAGLRPSEALGISWRAITTMMGAESALAWVFAAAYVSLAWWSPVVLVFADAAASSSIDRSRAHWILRHDQLTQLPNRLALTEHVAELRRKQTDRACVFYIDLDGFKEVNDTLGHQVGDEVLREIGNRLSDLTMRGDFLAHLHGDEFALVSATVPSEDQATELVDAVTRTVEVPIERGADTIRVSASVGYQFLGGASDLEAVLHDADQQMSAAKQARRIASGRDRRRR
ncbi:MAG: GGDEF domain-containing protein [Chloroflexota bacterium]